MHFVAKFYIPVYNQKPLIIEYNYAHTDIELLIVKYNCKAIDEAHKLTITKLLSVV